MINLYTSSFIVVNDGNFDFEIDQISINSSISSIVQKYDNGENYLSDIIPDYIYIENGGCSEGKTRIRGFLGVGKAQSTDKIKILINDLS